MRGIYSNRTEMEDSFDSAEHIFPKCIGGNRCLPKGWVSDSINNSFSRMEMGFARKNPIIILNRMFFKQTGRKKHTNREHIGVFRNRFDETDYSLGFVRDAMPYPVDQIVIKSENLDEIIGTPVSVHIVLSLEEKHTHEEHFHIFGEKLKTYNGQATYIKDAKIPPNIYMLGYNGKCWYLGVSSKNNPEVVNDKISRWLDKVLEEEKLKLLMDKGSFQCAVTR